MSELKELLNRAIWVAYWRDRDIDTEDGTFASTDIGEMIHLESAIQEFFDGMEANNLIATGRVSDYIEAAIKKRESTRLERVTKERDELKKAVTSMRDQLSKAHYLSPVEISFLVASCAATLAKLNQ